jgi:hypothetical protein
MGDEKLVQRVSGSAKQTTNKSNAMRTIATKNVVRASALRSGPGTAARAGTAVRATTQNCDSEPAELGPESRPWKLTTANQSPVRSAVEACLFLLFWLLAVAATIYCFDQLVSLIPGDSLSNTVRLLLR